ncbi:MAG: sugar phosphate isomerase/epimerase [Bacteroidota bacterium]
MHRALEIGIVSDEITRDLGEALDRAADWGIQRFELREGKERRFPFFTDEEIHLVDHALLAGTKITAVSPGIFKGNVEEAVQRKREIEDVFPRTVELAQRFGCKTVIAFAFDGCDNAPANRLHVLRAFEQIAEQAAAADLVVAFENEPAFWIDRPDSSVALLEEIGHPALRINWDPANLHWSGQKPDAEAFAILAPYLVNVHVKDYTPDDEAEPWCPLGEGIVPWATLLPDLAGHKKIKHLTIETHCKPLVRNSEASVEALRALLDAL